MAEEACPGTTLPRREQKAASYEDGGGMVEGLTCAHPAHHSSLPEAASATTTRLLMAQSQVVMDEEVPSQRPRMAKCCSAQTSELKASGLSWVIINVVPRHSPSPWNAGPALPDHQVMAVQFYHTRNK